LPFREDIKFTGHGFSRGLLIREFDYGYPVWIYDVCRADIGFDQKKARELKKRYA
jgi:hypothetical protein